MGAKEKTDGILTTKKLTHEQKAEVAGTAAFGLGLGSLAIPILVVPAASSLAVAGYEALNALLDDVEEEDSKNH